MRSAADGGAHLTPDDVALAVRDAQSGEAPRPPRTLLANARGKDVRPKTAGQRAFVDAIENNTLTFGIGPAGTGKTFLAVVMAVRALRNREISRIILSRPAVEAGEKLGFLPGDLKEKVDPYLRPLYDALFEMLDDAVVARFLERGTIEVAPLAYMRGRTLSDAPRPTLRSARRAQTLCGHRRRRHRRIRRGRRGTASVGRADRRGVRARRRRASRAVRRASRAIRRESRTVCRAPRTFRVMIYIRNSTRRYRLSTRVWRRRARALLAAPTDVLSFPLFEPFALPSAAAKGGAHGPERLLGDVVISLDTAARQARDYDASLNDEIERLLIHGILHLIGHDHERPGERRRMVREERRLAGAVGLAWPFDGAR